LYSNLLEPRSLIITCEACKQVNRLEAKNEEEAERIFNNFRCKNNCDRIYYSYITIGQLNLSDLQQTVTEAVEIV
jgi:hypothetical protein